MAPLSDISQLSATALSDHAITAHLGARFHHGLPISSISTNSLISINTFTSPEPFEIAALAARAYDRLLRRAENQLVVFLGESGSGKSELRNHLCSRLHSMSNETIVKRISCALFLFSALSTTKTSATPVASKAGLLIEYQYGSDAQVIGAKLISYRLDRERVARIPIGERNFHVLYYLLAGTTTPERDHLALDPSTRYRYLGHPTQLKIGINDHEGFSHFKSALRLLEFTRTEIAELCQVLAAIIHIGQLEFAPPGTDSDSDENHATVKSRYELEVIAAFLGVRPDDLEASLVYKTQSFRKERVTLVLDCAGARMHADDLARTIYAVLQSWVIESINEKLSQHESLISNTISIVDFPGFIPQTFGSASTNGPEVLNQLLYNSANEVLYNYMLFAFFDRLAQKFESEELQLPLVEYFDNTDTVKILTKHNAGILPLLDDHTRRGKLSTSVIEVMKKRFDKNPAIGLSPVSGTFSIRHYDGEVDYSIDRLLDANTDDISGDLMNLFSSTSSNFIKQLFATSAVTQIKHPREHTAVLQGQLSSKPLRQPSTLRKTKPVLNAEKEPKSYSATGQFNMALETLRSSFADANPYFIHCIRPNDRRIAGQFDVKCVRQQVHALGIADIARRVQVTDVSLFLPFSEVLGVAGFDESAMLASSDSQKVEQVLIEHSWTERDARIGTTGAFLSEAAWRELVDPSNNYLFQNAVDGTSSPMQKDNPFTDSKARLLTPSGGDGMGSYIYADNPDKTRSSDALTMTTAPGQGDMFQHFDSPQQMVEKGMHGREEEINDIKSTPSRRRWMLLVWLLTFWCPDSFIKKLGKMPRKDVRIAWREKLAINLLIWLACGLTVFFIVGFPILICPTQHVYSSSELSAYNYQDDPEHTYVAIRGEVFDLTKFAPGHYPSIVAKSEVMNYGGSDVSAMFPLQVSALCQGVDGSIDPSVTLDYNGENTTDSNSIYHDFRYFRNDSRPDWYFEQMIMLRANFKKGEVGISSQYMQTLVNEKGKIMASINGDVFDLTSYVVGGRQVLVPPGQTPNPNINRDFMSDTVVSLFQTQAGNDISKYWDNLDLDSDVKSRMWVCLRNLFYAGRVDTRNSAKCQFARYFLLAVSVFLVCVIGFKFLAALQFGVKRAPENLDKFVICQVPTYTEDEESLRRAIDSLARMKYDDKRKLLFIICDGMIVGAGNDRPTPRIVLDILGVSPDIDPEPLSFESLGEGLKQHNMGKIYSGLYEVAGHIVPFVVVVKVGKPSEISRPGNRGKRDSQMLLMRFLNRVHFNTPMNPLELELYHQIRNVIGVSPTFYEFILQVDADTEVAPDSATRMISAFLHDTKVIALCGETALSNAKRSIVTMMQVYEYYISHNLAKAFESLFGSVTCLPGCFSMYRVRTANSGKPLFVSNSVVQGYSEIRVDTLHVKNLLHLGEDRYLTTLLLRHHPTFKTKFIRDAHCLTVAPDSWKVFLSQRRRWINSTVHNLIELVPMSQLCGFCCFSMRFVVFLDLMSTIVQPVTVGYLVYLFYRLAVDTSTIPITSIIILVATYGLQAIIFVLRRKWEMIGWMIVYILAIPIFSFGVPIYAFWHMDDFSWGNTRVVYGEKGRKVLVSDEGKFDPASIPRKKWEDFQAELWEQYESQTASVYDAKSEVTSFRSRSFYPPQEYSTLDPSVRSPSVSPPHRALSQEYLGYHATGTAGPTPSQSVIFSQPSMVTPGGDVEMGTIDLPTDDMLLTEIREIIRTSDLMTITKKSIRIELERRFGGVSLDAKRVYINSATEAILAGEL
ncbi:chitin synthase-domain-containing protein [Lipomyces orientalis]|uniref:Chitin synthase-domain-containing protein n=1 Tax=Lipomyces orientalis TaxID=1233043 RepID=A0ACC3THL6_9ASCO